MRWGLAVLLVVGCAAAHPRYARGKQPPPTATPPPPEVVVTFRIEHVDEERYTNDVDVVVGTRPPRRVHLPQLTCGCQLEGNEWVDTTPGAVVLGCYFAGGGDYVVVHPDGNGRWTIRTFYLEEGMEGAPPPRPEHERVLLRFRVAPETTVRGVVEPVGD